MGRSFCVWRLGAAFACALVLSSGWSARARAAERPNILWVFVEDMNDWMGCYGETLIQTPRIDALAASGVRFDRAYMTAGVCSATRSAIALGAMQTTMGVHNHRSSRRRMPGEVIRLPEGVKSVYETFRANGYFVFTQGAGKDDFNFIWSPESFYDYRGRAMGYGGPVWRKRKDGRPFFGQIQLKGGKNTGKVAQKTDPAKVKVMPYYPDHPIIRGEIAHHYDCIKQTDGDLGRILDALEADNLIENTVVFFWTDHGFRAVRHKQFIYEGGIRVPLIVSGPGVPEGTARGDLVSGIDITATSLALAGIRIPPYMEGRNIFAKDHTPRKFVIAARDRCDYTIERIRAVVTPRFKYLRNFLTDRPYLQPQYRDGRPYLEIIRTLYKEGKLNKVQAAFAAPARPAEELYDLEIDPHETVNLAADPKFAEELDRHRAILETWIKETDDQGQYPESDESLAGVYRRWGRKCVNPEYDEVKKKMPPPPPRKQRKRKKKK